MRIVYDEANIYIGILCRDGEPGRIVANSLAHDNGGSSGRVRIRSLRPLDAERRPGPSSCLIPFRTSARPIFSSSIPRGARGEGLVYAGSSSLNWDGIWEARKPDHGRRLERRIPHPVQNDLLQTRPHGLGPQRRALYPAKTGDHPAVGDLPRQQFQQSQGSGRPGRHREHPAGQGDHLPSLRSGRVRKIQAAGTAADPKLDGGFDIYKSFTPNLVGVVSYNMDFAETETDERRINLTRFPLFFPEKRMFFPGRLGDVQFQLQRQFHALFQPQDRTVGRPPDPRPPGNQALRKDRRHEHLAVLDVQTGAYQDQPGRNLLAARVTQNIFAQSKVGCDFHQRQSYREKRIPWPAWISTIPPPTFLGDKNIMLAAWGALQLERAQGRPPSWVRIPGRLPQRLMERPDNLRLLRRGPGPGTGLHDAARHSDGLCAGRLPAAPQRGIPRQVCPAVLFQRQRRLLLGPDRELGDAPSANDSVRPSDRERRTPQPRHQRHPGRPALRFRGRRRDRPSGRALRFHATCR